MAAMTGASRYGLSGRRKRPLGLRSRKQLIELRELGRAQVHLRGRKILIDAMRLDGLRYRHHVRLADGPGERDLRGAQAPFASDLRERRMRGEFALSERRVGHRRDAARALPRQQRILDAARLERVV